MGIAGKVGEAGAAKDAEFASGGARSTASPGGISPRIRLLSIGGIPPSTFASLGCSIMPLAV